jgi:hypothetical protein
MPLGFTRLDAPEASAVARDRDLAPDADAERVEGRVVLDQAVIDVHQRRRDIAVASRAVHGRKDREVRGGVARNRWLGEIEPDPGRLHQFYNGRLGIWQVDLEIHPAGVETGARHLAQYVGRGLLLRRRAGDVRLG